MTDKLKCPFCGAELEYVVSCRGVVTDNVYCPNSKCETMGNWAFEKVWELAIDGKKAQDALSRANEYLDMCLDNRENEDVAISAQYLKDEITSIMKGKDNE